MAGTARHKPARILATLGLLVSATTGATADDDGMVLKLERAGHWGGCSTDIQIAGDLAYMAIGPRLVVLDISGPGDPTFLGESEPLPNAIMAIDIEGAYAYAATYYDGLHILDIACPSDIKHLGSDRPGNCYDGVAVYEDYVYAGDRESVLYTYAVHDPTQPTFITSTPLSGHVHAVYDADCFLYVSTWNGVDIFDLSNPANPQHIRTITEDYDEVEYNAGLLYGICFDRLDVWNVSDPHLPVLEGSYASETFWGCNCVAISNGFAYAASYTCDLIHAIDISDPSAPIHKGTTPVSGWPHAMTANEKAVYVANWYDGLAVFDISAQAEPVQTGVFDNSVIAHYIGMHDNHVYLTGYRNEVQIIYVNAPEAPERVGQQALGSSQMHVEGDTAYIVNSRPSDDRGLKIARFNDEHGLDFLSNTPFPDTPSGIDVEGDVAYVTVFDTGLFIVEITDPEAPAMRGSCLLDAPTPMRVVVRHPFAYVTGGYGGVWYVVDVSDPDNPFHVRTLECLENAASILLEGDRLYIGRFKGFDIYSISEPDNPTLLGQFSKNGLSYITCMRCKDDRVYISPGLSAVDVSDPANPRLLGSNIHGSMLAKDMELQGRYIYAAQNSSGLSVFKISLAGDFDDDGTVGKADLAELLCRYGACAGDGLYSEAVDLDESGCIDLGDLAGLLGRYGNEM